MARPLRYGMLLAVALVAGYGGSGADAAYYKQGKPAFRIEFRVGRDRIEKAQIRSNFPCDHDHRQGLLFTRKRIPLGAAGAFTLRDESQSDVLSQEIRLRGHVRPNFVIGYFAFRADWAPGGGRQPYRCWSGRSWEDPWIRFAARRQRAVDPFPGLRTAGFARPV